MNDALPIMNLRRLRYFVTLADTLHFGRAADRLHIAQPALSQQIAKLEAELDIALLDRSSRRVALTRAGEFLRGEAERLLVAADSLGRAVGQLRDGDRGVLRLGFVDSAAYEIVPRFLHRYRTRWPEVAVELHSMSSDDQLAALAHGRIDVGLARTVGDARDTRTRVVHEGRLWLAVDEGHRLAERKRVRFRDLDGETFIGISVERSPTLHGELSALLAAAGVRYAPSMQAVEYTTILGLVAAGEGVALVPAWITGLRLPHLRYVRVADEAATTRLLLLARLHDPQPIVDRAFAVVES